MTQNYKTNLPVYWEVEKQLTEADTQEVIEMRETALRCGLVRGLCIPVHGPFEDFAILVLAETEGQNCLENWQAQQHDFLSIAHYFYEYFKPLLLLEQKISTAYVLSPRQKQCLQLVAEQTSVAEIATILGVSERTVNFHIQRANKILGTKNKH